MSLMTIAQILIGAVFPVFVLIAFACTTMLFYAVAEQMREGDSRDSENAHFGSLSNDNALVLVGMTACVVLTTAAVTAYATLATALTWNTTLAWLVCGFILSITLWILDARRKSANTTPSEPLELWDVLIHACLTIPLGPILLRWVVPELIPAAAKNAPAKGPIISF